MKKYAFMALFVGFQVAFVALRIYKQGKIIKLSYQTQYLEAKKEVLAARKQKLTNDLYDIKRASEVKSYACQQLAMEPLKLKQIKRIPST